MAALVWAHRCPQSYERGNQTPDNQICLIWSHHSLELLLWASGLTLQLKTLAGFSCVHKQLYRRSSSRNVITATCVSTEGPMQTSGAQKPSSFELWPSSYTASFLFFFSRVLNCHPNKSTASVTSLAPHTQTHVWPHHRSNQTFNLTLFVSFSPSSFNILSLSPPQTISCWTSTLRLSSFLSTLQLLPSWSLATEERSQMLA